ncbi:MAG: hypothetical protein Q4F70_05450, partial [Clostridia bacterium]|nr:hypothetical protein [Clostridia bacterium]
MGWISKSQVQTNENMIMDKNIVGGFAPSGVEMIHTPSINFRSLLPSEVDVRPAEVRDFKTTLLLYQD